MAAVASPRFPVTVMGHDHDMDTRTPSPPTRHVSNGSSNEKSGGEAADYKPGLNDEVALLSAKLVNAINYQTNLDDSLQQCRHELQQAQARLAVLEVQKQHMDEQVATGVLVKKADVDKTIARLRAELATEKAARVTAEKAKKQTESELENLTSALFEEANGMVVTARKDTEAMEKRNAQLKSQLQDQEVIMASQQEQLQDLKGTMEKLQTESPAMNPRDPSMPSTPITAQHALFDALHLSPGTADIAEQTPEQPLHFSQLIVPLLRNDITAFADFQDLLLLARRMGAHSRSNSNNTSNGLYSNQAASASFIASSSPNLPGSFSFANSSPNSSYGSTSNMPPLKESKFYKRVLTEDIEPTLRLDLAPGLSFLSRRTVLGALLQGTLAVEPYPQNKHYFACTLCGESRRNEPYVRKYRFRTSEEDNVSKPICDYCLTRLRSSCDFVGFLRMVRDGHWKCDTEEDQKSAWEESVRLREKMFWARLGGGVVPCVQQTLQQTSLDTPSSATGVKSSRQSLDSIPEGDTKDEEGDVIEQKPASIANTIVGMSTDATSTAMPNRKSQSTDSALAENAVQENDFVEPQAGQQLQTELNAEAGNGAEATDPTTPFEDANEEQEHLPVPASNKQEYQEAESIATPQEPPTKVEPKEEATLASQRTNLSPRGSLRVSRESSPMRKSVDVERKNSSVLARVKAMEAAKSG